MRPTPTKPRRSAIVVPPPVLWYRYQPIGEGRDGRQGQRPQGEAQRRRRDHHERHRAPCRRLADDGVARAERSAERVGQDAPQGRRRGAPVRLPAQSHRRQPVVQALQRDRAGRAVDPQLALRRHDPRHLRRGARQRPAPDDRQLRPSPGGRGGAGLGAAGAARLRPGAAQHHPFQAPARASGPHRHSGGRDRQPAGQADRHGGELLQLRRRARHDRPSRPAGLSRASASSPCRCATTTARASAAAAISRR